jgi:hypothetical protein
MERSQWLRPLIQYTGLAVMGIIAVLTLFFFKVHNESRQAFARAESELHRGRSRESIVHYERAIMWYTPFSPDVRQAIDRLWRVGKQAEANHDHTLALHAYRSLRAALYSTRSFYQPYMDWIAKSEKRIVDLMATEKAGINADASQIAKHRARYAHMHARKLGPTLEGTRWTVVGFFGWVGTTLGFLKDSGYHAHASGGEAG